MDSAQPVRTLALVLLFIAALALLPWLLRRWQRRHGSGAGAASGAVLRVLSAVAVGPQQRVLMVEAGSGNARVWLVLGVGAQQLRCLHVLPVCAPAAAGGAVVMTGAETASFAHAMDSAINAPARPAND